jgi:hypothetical protein
MSKKYVYVFLCQIKYKNFFVRGIFRDPQKITPWEGGKEENKRRS